MSTVMEGEFDEVLPVVRRAHQRMRDEHSRVFTLLMVDDHGPAEDRLHGSVRDIVERAGRSHSE